MLGVVEQRTANAYGDIAVGRGCISGLGGAGLIDHFRILRYDAEAIEHDGDVRSRKSACDDTSM
jgi:hypothetical protein